MTDTGIKQRWSALEPRLRLALGACSLAGLAACSGGSGDAPAAPGGGGSEITSGAYLPDDGLIVVEFESGNASGDWVEETALAGFTGTSYLRWDGPDLFSTPGQDAFGFDLWIEEPGDYHFRIHNRHEDPDSTMANDLWVRMDGGAWVKAYSWQRGQWTWATNHEFSSTNKPPAEYTLARGNHRIEFSGRSFDFMVDRFHLYDDDVVNPEDTSHPESARASGSSAGMGSGMGTPGGGRRLRVAPFHQALLSPSGGAGMGPIDEELAELDARLGRIMLPDGIPIELVVRGAVSVERGGADLGVAAPVRDALLAHISQWLGARDAIWVVEARRADGLHPMADLAERIRSRDPWGRPVLLRSGVPAPEATALQLSAFDAVEPLRPATVSAPEITEGTLPR